MNGSSRAWKIVQPWEHNSRWWQASSATHKGYSRSSSNRVESTVPLPLSKPGNALYLLLSATWIRIIAWATAIYVLAFALSTATTMAMCTPAGLQSAAESDPLTLTPLRQSVWFSVSAILSAPIVDPWNTCSATLHVVYATIAIILNVFVFAIITAKFMR